MSNYAMVYRFKVIIECITNKDLPTKQDILNSLFKAGLEVSERTLDRDLERLREDFEIEILYDKSYKGYYFEDETKLAVQEKLHFLEILAKGAFLSETLKSYKGALQFLSFDVEGGLKGVDWLPVILKAIMERKVIKFVYQRFMDEEKTHTIAPYLLREFRNRWYVVGIYKDETNFLSFGVDRIKSLEILDKRFEYNNALNPKHWFENVIGFPYNKTQVEKVVLSFTPLQGKYVKTLPLHHSQEILIDNDKELRVALYLVVNFELEMEILKYGSSVKVLAPESLAESIKNKLAEALKKY